MKFEFNWPSGFRGEDVWKCWRTDGRTDDGRRSHWYTNSSPRSLRLRWAKKAWKKFPGGRVKIWKTVKLGMDSMDPQYCSELSGCLGKTNKTVPTPFIEDYFWSVYNRWWWWWWDTNAQTQSSHQVRGNRKRYQQSTNADQKSIETVFLIAICRQWGDKCQSKTLFLSIFDIRSSIVLAFSIAAYPVWCTSITSLLRKVGNKIVQYFNTDHKKTQDNSIFF